eukprot:5497223-Amphidinium_carterae.1
MEIFGEDVVANMFSHAENKDFLGCEIDCVNCFRDFGALSLSLLQSVCVCVCTAHCDRCQSDPAGPQLLVHMSHAARASHSEHGTWWLSLHLRTQQQPKLKVTQTPLLSAKMRSPVDCGDGHQQGHFKVYGLDA